MTTKPTKPNKPNKTTKTTGRTKKLKPIHPGEVLWHDFMEPLGLSNYRVAKETGLSPQHIGRILKGERGVGGEAALRLAAYFGTSAQLWIGLQAQHDLDIADDAIGREIRAEVRPYKAA